MRLVRYRTGRTGPSRAGLLRPDGAVVDLVDAWAGHGAATPWREAGDDPLLATLAAGPEVADALRTLLTSASGAAVVDAERVLLTAPVRPSTVVATGWNFADHVDEAKGRVDATVPDTPTGFLKLPSAITGPGTDVVRPRRVRMLDYEVELAAVLCRPAYRLDAAGASKAIGGYTLMNDVSARDVQEPEMRAGLLLAGKNFPTFAPFGPTVVPAWEFDATTARLRLSVNGEVRQDAAVGSATRDLPTLVAYWTGVFPLDAGDVVTLGSPPGVAYGGSETYLRPGDVMTASEESIGELTNRVVAERSDQ